MGIGALVQEQIVGLVKVSGIPDCHEVAAQARGHAKTPPKPFGYGGFIGWGLGRGSSYATVSPSHPTIFPPSSRIRLPGATRSVRMPLRAFRVIKLTM